MNTLPAHNALITAVFGSAAIPVDVNQLGPLRLDVYAQPESPAGAPRSALIIAESFWHGWRFAAFAPQVSGGPLKDLYFLITPEGETFSEGDFPLRGSIRSPMSPLAAKRLDLANPQLPDGAAREAGEFPVSFDRRPDGSVYGSETRVFEDGGRTISPLLGGESVRLDSAAAQAFLQSAVIFVGEGDRLLGGYNIPGVEPGESATVPFMRINIEKLPLEDDRLPSRRALQLFRAEDWKKWIMGCICGKRPRDTSTNGAGRTARPVFVT